MENMGFIAYRDGRKPNYGCYIEIEFADGFTYAEHIAMTEPIDGEDPFGQKEIDVVRLNADRAYCAHNGASADYYNVLDADEEIAVLYVNGVVMWN